MSTNGNGSAPKRNGTNRNPDGTFKKGHPGGPGRKPSKRGEIMNRLWDEELGVEECRDTLRSLIKCARKGEAWAIQEILNRTLGKPSSNVKLEGVLTIDKALALLRDDRLAITR